MLLQFWEFGNVPLVKDVRTEMSGWLWLDRLFQDTYFALRQIRRAPEFAITVIGTLALGIGAAAAFTVVDNVLLRPLPFHQASQLVALQERGTMTAARSGAPWLDIAHWAARSQSFSQIAFFNGMAGRTFLEDNRGGTMQISGEMVSPNLFPPSASGQELSFTALHAYRRCSQVFLVSCTAGRHHKRPFLRAWRGQPPSSMKIHRLTAS